MPPAYATAEFLAEHIPSTKLPMPLLCPHCNTRLLPARVARPKTAATGVRAESPAPSTNAKRTRKRAGLRTKHPAETYLAQPQEP